MQSQPSGTLSCGEKTEISASPVGLSLMICMTAFYSWDKASCRLLYIQRDNWTIMYSIHVV